MVAADAAGDDEADEEELPPCDPFSPPLTGNDGADMSLPVPPGEARAGKLTDAADVPGGVKSWAEAGDFLIRNSRVGFVIENDAGREGFTSHGFNPYGGEFVLADVWSEDGPSGQNLFGEAFFGLGIQIVDPETITVLSDGTDGREAVVRVTGELKPVPILAGALADLLDPFPFGGEMFLDYILGGDDEHIRVRYTVRNPFTRMVRIHTAVIAMVMGDGLKSFTEKDGFAPGDVMVRHRTIGFVGDRISYGFLDGRGGELGFGVEYSGILIANLSRYIEVEACGETQVDAFDLVVASGGAEPLISAVRRTRGEPEPPGLTGTVSLEGGGGLPGARVHVLRDDGSYVTSALTDEEGRYRAGLAPGDYRVSAVLEGYEPRVDVPLVMGSGDQTLDLTLPPPATLRYTVTDDASNPIPAKIIIFPETAPPPLPDSFGAARYPQGAVRYIFETDGAGEILLPAGGYRVHGSRGFWYDTDEETIEASEGEVVSLDLVLPDVVDRTGYLCGDFHHHGINSPDSSIPPEVTVSANAAEGLDIIVSTDHDWITDHRPVVEALGLGGFVKAFTGQEITTFEYGHINAYPVTVRIGERNNGAVEHFYMTPQEVFSNALSDPLGPVLQLNHPRATGAGGYLSAVQFDPLTCRIGDPEDWSDLWSVVEVFNSGDFRGHEEDDVPDWFGLLSCGYRVPATGTSDSHNCYGDELGYNRTCPYFGHNDPSLVTEDDLTGALLGLNVLVSGGAFITVHAGGATMGDVASAPGGDADLDIVVQAAEWIGLDRMRIFVNGLEVLTVVLDETTRDPLDPVVRFRSSVPVSTGGGDGWAVVEVEGDARMDPVSEGDRPWAVTNPIFLDADGDGAITL